MFTREEATASDLWNITQANGQSLYDFMEKFKSVVSEVDFPNSIAVESLKNTIHVKSLFQSDLYQNPTRSLADAIARSHNFIRMEEDTKDTRVILGRQSIAKDAAAKQNSTEAADKRQEPRQHSFREKNNQNVTSSMLSTRKISQRPQSSFGKRDGTYTISQPLSTTRNPKPLPSLRVRTPQLSASTASTIRLIRTIRTNATFSTSSFNRLLPAANWKSNLPLIHNLRAIKAGAKTRKRRVINPRERLRRPTQKRPCSRQR